jgi:acyl-CoA synthetase (AMP-forming)/AMP-acid ligase II
MTEVVSVAFTAPGTGLPVRSSTAGRVLLGSEVQAVNETRSPLPAGQFGELRIRSPQRMIGYTDASLTAQQMDAAGWFYTGDIGMVDDEGWVTLSGRIKDIINRAGEKFSARDIEEAIEGHPSVDRVAVVGLPDERLGEIVGAFLMLNDARSWTGPETLIEHLRGLKIANQKIPVEWHVMEALPVTASGKLQKHELIRLREANT